MIAAIASGCTLSYDCKSIGYFDSVVMSTGAQVPAASVAALCLGTRCFAAPFDGGSAPFGRLASGAEGGQLVFVLQAGTVLRDRALPVTLTLADGRVLTGTAPKPAKTRPAGPHCDPPQRTATVELH